MTLIEQGEMIARFMGFKPYEDGRYGTMWPDPSKEGNPVVIGMCYHASWDWLMPVVEKLESIGFAIHIDEDRVFIHFPRNHEMIDFTKEECGSKIATVYKAVFAGVEWVLDKTEKAL